MAEPEEDCLQAYQHIFHPDILKGKVAFVTGGGSGIGFTITEILMRHGCNTVIASRKLERVQKAAKTLEQATGQKCLPLQMDVRKPQQIMDAVDKALAEFKTIDILVNNAAGNFLSPAAGLSFNAFKTVMEIDAFGTFFTSKVVYEKSLRDHGGVIVNISATLPYRGQVFQTHAGSAKAAIDAMTKHLAVEWGPNNIRVVGVAPGPIGDTEGVRRLAGRGTGRQEEIRATVPLGRMGTRAEMAHTVLFLVSPAAGYITGETVVADGGSWLTMGNSMTEAVARLNSYHTKSKM